MIRKEMSALLLLCILLVYSGKSSAMNKGEKNITGLNTKCGMNEM